jgi:hypothetical protein
MTLDEQIIACARADGYDGKGTKVTRPQYSGGGDMGEWWIRDEIIVRRVTDEDFKQWQRDYKLKQIGID